MNTGPRLVVALALLGGAACDTDGPEPGPAGTFAVHFCAKREAPAWVAQQDGDGAWRQLLPQDGVYEYEVALRSSRGGLAFILEGRPSFMYGTRTELEAIAASLTGDCGNKTVLGTVAGVPSGRYASVSLGVATDAVSGTGPDRSLRFEGVSDGPQDLIARLYNGEAQETYQYIARWDVDAADGTTLDVLDFDSSESTEPATAALTVTGADGGFVWRAVLNEGGILSSGWTPPGTSSAMYSALPGSRLPAGRLQGVRALVSGGGVNFGTGREAGAYFRDARDLRIALGPDMAVPAYSAVESGGFAWPRLDVAAQAEYDRAIDVLFYADAHVARVVVTAAYAGGLPGIWQASVPNVNGVPGYDPAWSFIAGEAVSHDVVAMGGTYVPVLDRAPEEGDVYRATTRNE